MRNQNFTTSFQGLATLHQFTIAFVWTDRTYFYCLFNQNALFNIFCGTYNDTMPWPLHCKIRKEPIHQKNPRNFTKYTFYPGCWPSATFCSGQLLTPTPPCTSQQCSCPPLIPRQRQQRLSQTVHTDFFIKRLGELFSMKRFARVVILPWEPPGCCLWSSVSNYNRNFVWLAQNGSDILITLCMSLFICLELSFEGLTSSTGGCCTVLEWTIGIY